MGIAMLPIDNAETIIKVAGVSLGVGRDGGYVKPK